VFASSGCGVCHRSSLRVELPRAGPSAATREAAQDAASHALIHPYTDLLLHDMGQGLADRNAGRSNRRWCTIPPYSIPGVPQRAFTPVVARLR